MEVNGPVVGRVYSAGEVLHWRLFVPSSGLGELDGEGELLADLIYLLAFGSVAVTAWMQRQTNRSMSTGRLAYYFCL
jgi:hypothetical protein